MVNEGKISILLVRTGAYPTMIKTKNTMDQMEALLGGTLSMKTLDDGAILVSRSLPEITVEDFLRQHPTATVDMMTPGGYVKLSPEQAKVLLKGGNVSAHLGVSGTNHLMHPDELLPQGVANIIQDKNTKDHFSLITDAALPLNRALVNTFLHKEIISGDFIVAGGRKNELADLPKDLEEKYAQKFHSPERFYNGREGLVVQKYTPHLSQNEPDPTR